MRLPDDFDIDSLPVIGEGAAQTPQAQATTPAPPVSPAPATAPAPQTQPQAAGFDIDSLPELPRIPTTEEKSAQFEEWKRRRDAAQAASDARPETDKPMSFGDVMAETGRRLATYEGIKRNTEESPWYNLPAHVVAYGSDVLNSVVGGFLGGTHKITEGVGRVIGSAFNEGSVGNRVGRALVEEGQAQQAAVQQTFPTQALDTTGGGVVNKALQIGKNVAAVSGEFAPAAIPGIGQAYSASLVGAGSVNRAAEVREAAKANGMSDAQADALSFGAGAIDALQNILLMKGFRGIWGGAKNAAADGVKRSLVRKMVGDMAKTGATMGTGAAAQDVVNQNVGINEKGKPHWNSSEN